MTEPYPDGVAARDRWIVARRPNLDTERSQRSVWRPAHWLTELEPDGCGHLLPTLAIFLLNRECPWRCLMCDLWQQTTLETIPDGAVPAQMDWTAQQLERG